MKNAMDDQLERVAEEMSKEGTEQKKKPKKQQRSKDEEEEEDTSCSHRSENFIHYQHQDKNSYMS